ncbi:hypothetical protein, partial [Akkermansia sp.]
MGDARGHFLHLPALWAGAPLGGPPLAEQAGSQRRGGGVTEFFQQTEDLALAMPPQELWIFLARCRVSCSNFVLNAMYRYSISREDFHACVNHLLGRRARKAFYAVHLKRGIFQVIALLIIFYVCWYLQANYAESGWVKAWFPAGNVMVFYYIFIVLIFLNRNYLLWSCISRFGCLSRQ